VLIVKEIIDVGISTQRLRTPHIAVLLLGFYVKNFKICTPLVTANFLNFMSVIEEESFLDGCFRVLTFLDTTISTH
jgi:hypothetical protein